MQTVKVTTSQNIDIDYNVASIGDRLVARIIDYAIFLVVYSVLATIFAASLVTLVIGVVLLWFAGPLPYMRSFTGALAPGPVEDRPGIPFPRGYLSLDPVWWLWDTPTLGGSVTILLIISMVVSLVLLRRRVKNGTSSITDSNQVVGGFIIV